MSIAASVRSTAVVEAPDLANRHEKMPEPQPRSRTRFPPEAGEIKALAQEWTSREYPGLQILQVLHTFGKSVCGLPVGVCHWHLFPPQAVALLGGVRFQIDRAARADERVFNFRHSGYPVTRDAGALARAQAAETSPAGNTTQSRTAHRYCRREECPIAAWA